MVGAAGVNDEIKFDNFIVEFRQMIKLAESLLIPLSLTKQVGQKPYYVFGAQIIPPLFITACKCRHPELRRKALDLLWNLKSREGMWDSDQAAAVGKWVIDKEEEGGEMIKEAQSIPVEARISLFGRGIRCGERRCLVKYCRGPAIQGKDQTEEEYLTW